MTRRDYYFSDELEADTRVVACEESDGRYSVELEHTIFHPQGGGQLADAGWINGSPVLAVESHGDAIHHIVSQPLPLGDARLKINAETRALHSRLHSAGHLIGHVGMAWGMTPSKAQHWPNASRVVFQFDGSTAPDLAVLEAEVQALLRRSLEREH
jgi:Ser-tRNA(Ala) deacylase AlaX